MRTATRLRDLAQYLHRQADTMIDVPGLTPWVDLLHDMSKLADKSAIYHRQDAVPLPSIESLAGILGDELSDPIDTPAAEIARLREALATVLMQANAGHATTVNDTSVTGAYLAQGTFAHIRDTAEHALGVTQ